jgi:hypothetical protein
LAIKPGKSFSSGIMPWFGKSYLGLEAARLIPPVMDSLQPSMDLLALFGAPLVLLELGNSWGSRYALVCILGRSK